MPNIVRPIYFERFQTHVKGLEKHLEEGDYVQAAEKVWGAISSFINAFLQSEKRRVKEKKQGFNSLFGQFSVEYPSLKESLNNNGFSNPYQFVAKAVGLHVYFYGSRRYKKNQLRDILQKYASVLGKIYDVVSEED